MNELTIIIVSFNSADIIDRCQKELLSSGIYPTLLVDNASPDGSAVRLQEQFPEIEVIAMAQNIGYGRGANVGLRKAKTPYALLLNPDLIVSAKEIEKLLFCAQNDMDNTAIWGPATKQNDFTSESPEEVHWISGSAILFDVEKVRQIGLFDENIFLFSEETDLYERTLSAGYKIKLCHNAFFDHIAGQACPYDPDIEYMKWWHFGWSQCYRMTKNGHSSFFRNPWRKRLAYRLHSFISVDREKRMKWGAKGDGASAFLRGEKAFDDKGVPACYNEKGL